MAEPEEKQYANLLALRLQRSADKNNLNLENKFLSCLLTYLAANPECWWCRRYDCALDSLKLFSFSESSSPLITSFKNSMVEQLSKCIHCVDHYHRGIMQAKQQYLTQFEKETVVQFFRQLSHWDVSRITKSLQVITKTLNERGDSAKSDTVLFSRISATLYEILKHPNYLVVDSVNDEFEKCITSMQTIAYIVRITDFLLPGVVVMLFHANENLRLYAKFILQSRTSLIDVHELEVIRPLLKDLVIPLLISTIPGHDIKISLKCVKDSPSVIWSSFRLFSMHVTKKAYEVSFQSMLNVFLEAIIASNNHDIFEMLSCLTQYFSIFATKSWDDSVKDHPSLFIQRLTKKITFIFKTYPQQSLSQRNLGIILQPLAPFLWSMTKSPDFQSVSTMLLTWLMETVKDTDMSHQVKQHCLHALVGALQSHYPDHRGEESWEELFALTTKHIKWFYNDTTSTLSMMGCVLFLLEKNVQDFYSAICYLGGNKKIEENVKFYQLHYMLPPLWDSINSTIASYAIDSPLCKALCELYTKFLFIDIGSDVLTVEDLSGDQKLLLENLKEGYSYMSNCYISTLREISRKSVNQDHKLPPHFHVFMFSKNESLRSLSLGICKTWVTSSSSNVDSSCTLTMEESLTISTFLQDNPLDTLSIAIKVLDEFFAILCNTKFNLLLEAGSLLRIVSFVTERVFVLHKDKNQYHGLSVGLIDPEDEQTEQCHNDLVCAISTFWVKVWKFYYTLLLNIPIMSTTFKKENLEMHTKYVVDLTSLTLSSVNSILCFDVINHFYEFTKKQQKYGDKLRGEVYLHFQKSWNIYFGDGVVVPALGDKGSYERTVPLNLILCLERWLDILDENLKKSVLSTLLVALNSAVQYKKNVLDTERSREQSVINEEQLSLLNDKLNDLKSKMSDESAQECIKKIRSAIESLSYFGIMMTNSPSEKKSEEKEHFESISCNDSRQTTPTPETRSGSAKPKTDNLGVLSAILESTPENIKDNEIEEYFLTQEDLEIPEDFFTAPFNIDDDDADDVILVSESLPRESSIKQEFIEIKEEFVPVKVSEPLLAKERAKAKFEQLYGSGVKREEVPSSSVHISKDSTTSTQSLDKRHQDKERSPEITQSISLEKKAPIIPLSEQQRVTTFITKPTKSSTSKAPNMFPVFDTSRMKAMRSFSSSVKPKSKMQQMRQLFTHERRSANSIKMTSRSNVRTSRESMKRDLDEEDAQQVTELPSVIRNHSIRSESESGGSNTPGHEKFKTGASSSSESEDDGLSGYIKDKKNADAERLKKEEEAIEKLKRSQQKNSIKILDFQKVNPMNPRAQKYARFLNKTDVADARNKSSIIKSTEEALTLAKLKPNLDKLHKLILSWDFINDVNDKAEVPPNMEKSALKTVPDTFNDPNEYFSTLKPLLILEVWEQLVSTKSDLQVVSDNQVGKLVLRGRQTIDDFVDLTFTMNQNQLRIMGDNDLIYLFQKSDNENKTGNDENNSFPLPPNGFIGKLSVNSTSSKLPQNEVEVTVRLFPVPSKRRQLSSLLLETSWCGIKVMSLSTLHREFIALNSVQNYPLLHHILNPGQHSALKQPVKTGLSIKECMKSFRLNEPQAIALDACLNERDGFTLVQGPPGTGKSQTIVAMVGAFLSTDANIIRTPGGLGSGDINDKKKKHLLICAPSNAAIDCIVRRLAAGVWDKKGVRRSFKIVRVGNPEIIHHAVEKCTLDYLVEREMEADSDFSEASQLRKKVNLSENNIANTRSKIQELNRLSTKLDQLILDCSDEKDKASLDNQIRDIIRERKKLQEELRGQRKAIDTAFKRMDSVRLEVRNKILNSADVICSTLSGSGHELFQSLEYGFDTVIIDEAAQVCDRM
jgi:hypothetical protein